MTDDQNTSTESQLIEQRRAKLAELRARGQAYPNDFRRDTLASDIRTRFANATEEELEANPVRVKIAGRMMTRRIMGKATFAHVKDMSERIQLYVKRDTLGEETYNAFKHWDLGDILGAAGTVFRTKAGELSVMVDELRLLTKALRPLPEKFHGLTDQEARYRQRYLDLIMNDESRRTFRIRAQVVDQIRRYLQSLGFSEVETPMMQAIAGGAMARPFITHHNALDMDLYLRIAPELYLKRLVVGGMEKVFEINRNFRNEGLSTRHNPEFTMLEFYMAYADYRDLIDLTEDMLRTVAQNVLGTTLVEYQGQSFDFGKPFARLTVKEAILAANADIAAADLEDLDECRAIAERLGIHLEKGYGLGKLQTEIFEKTAEHGFIQPTFVTEYPAEVSPLARRSDTDPFVTDRFELFIAGREIANGFSELNDPDDQAERFRAQVAAKAGGDAEAMAYDADYIQALEFGLPPTAGEGIGIDRLVMLFTNAGSIRDVLLFPHMRPRD
ncbi:MAG: lysine--tRNA ligase [Gammaproteobacteria bacterium]|nr:lysine--tRNA ligase [Gammaproteobacteria bacterium]MBI5615506.1 lysine--tRNA ligase [Gammaproteobacteria bacterium]